MRIQLLSDLLEAGLQNFTLWRPAISFTRIVNARISKIGGILRTLDFVDKATKLGIRVILGAHVGETSILTRAGMIVMSAMKPDLLAAEGAFGTYLLRRDLVSPSLMFGDGGVLTAERGGIGDLPGFGLQLDSQALVPVE